MPTIATHPIAASVIDAKNRTSADLLDTLLGEPVRPDGLPTIVRRAVQLAAGQCALGDGDAGARTLRRAARAGALLFVHARHPQEATFLEIDDGLAQSVEGAADPSLVSAPAWAEAMWCAMAVGDGLSQEWLGTVPSAELASPGLRRARYAFALGEFLRSLVTQDGRHGSWLVQATEQLDDGADAGLAHARDQADEIDLPAVRAAYHALEGEGDEFNEALADLLESHRRHWSRAELRQAVDGLLSTRACALARMAAALGIAVTVESGYMPPAVWKAETPHPLRCPYCVGPLPDGAPACGLCGSALRDAPLEITHPTPRAEHEPCRACRYPLHRFATLCPQCRTARRKA